MGNSGSNLTGIQSTEKGNAAAPATCPVNHEARKPWLEAARKNPPPAPELSLPPDHLLPSISEREEEWSRALDARSEKERKGENVGPSPEPSPEVLAFIKHNKAWFKQQDLPGVSPEQLARRREAIDRLDMLKVGNELDDPPKLGTERVTSTIPRADMAPPTTTPDPRSLPSPDVPPKDKPGNWIYPSEKMFFDAMKRKSFTPKEEDMPAIVPIHNAVNERAWSLIKTWETSSARLKALNAPCGGPKLRSFSGDAAKLSPKARMLGWLGYQGPFDRHDWVVERCQGGGSVEYVIDFYKGKGDGLTFYLDVRPKLNTWEGCRMRMGHFVGLT
ncbi:MAG: hypothetical protein Q9181_006797 [Wetmoreana brouardii]